MLTGELARSFNETVRERATRDLGISRGADGRGHPSFARRRPRHRQARIARLHQCHHRLREARRSHRSACQKPDAHVRTEWQSRPPPIRLWSFGRCGKRPAFASGSAPRRHEARSSPVPCRGSGRAVRRRGGVAPKPPRNIPFRAEDHAAWSRAIPSRIQTAIARLRPPAASWSSAERWCDRARRSSVPTASFAPRALRQEFFRAVAVLCGIGAIGWRQARRRTGRAGLLLRKGPDRRSVPPAIHRSSGRSPDERSDFRDCLSKP